MIPSCLSFASLLRSLRALFVILTLLPGVSLWAQEQAGAQDYVLPPITDADKILLPADFNRVDFYLVTVDVGNQVWDNFGHTALRVVDRNSNSDLVFNWGLFDPSGGYVRFAVNFLRGILPYQLGVSPPAWEFGRYEREQRSVWQDKLNLTNAQKETLYKRLAWNLREENIVYDYQYFFDNCTTRVRDYLNEALGGRLQAQNRAPSQNTFRDEVLSHYASVPPVALSLDVLMNGNIDRRMSQWEQMFLPAQLRRELLSFPSDVTRNGQRVDMLEEPTVIMEFTPPAAGPKPYYLLLAGLSLPALLLLLMFRRTSLASFSSQPGVTLRSPALSYRLLGLLGVLISLCSGIYGLIMSFGWFASAHLDLHHNLNLLLFWPTDLLGLVYGLRWLLSGHACSVSAGRRSLLILYLFAHILAALAYVFMGLTGMGGQEVGSLLLFVLPGLVGFAIVVWNTGFQTIRRIRFS